MIEVLLPLINGEIRKAEVKQFTFSGGEEHVNVTTVYNVNSGSPITIKAQLTSSSEVMQLLLTVDAIRKIYGNELDLFMPYIPYARQDRVCQPGDAFSLAVFAKLINDLGFRQVTVVDPHSEVSQG